MNYSFSSSPFLQSSEPILILTLNTFLNRWEFFSKTTLSYVCSHPYILRLQLLFSFENVAASVRPTHPSRFSTWIWQHNLPTWKCPQELYTFPIRPASLPCICISHQPSNQYTVKCRIRFPTRTTASPSTCALVLHNFYDSNRSKKIGTFTKPCNSCHTTNHE